MSLKESLMQDLKTAMKEKNLIKKNTIQLVRTAILQEEKDKQIVLSDSDVIQVVANQIKKRKSSLPDYEASGRTDLVDQINEEIDVLMSYLPKQMDDSELIQLVEQVISDIGAISMKDMGKVMSTVIEKVEGKADNKRISAMVKQKLSNN